MPAMHIPFVLDAGHAIVITALLVCLILALNFD
jgi:hypothetical protein